MELSDSKVELVARKNKVVYQDGSRVVKVFNGTKPAGDVFNEALNVARIAETPIKHPHVLEVSQVADGSWALATEYVPGKTLAALMAEEGADFDALLEKFVDLQVSVQKTAAPALLSKQKEKVASMIGRVKELDPSVRYDLQMRADRMAAGKSVNREKQRLFPAGLRHIRQRKIGAHTAATTDDHGVFFRRIEIEHSPGGDLTVIKSQRAIHADLFAGRKEALQRGVR